MLALMFNGRAEAGKGEQEYWNSAIYQKQKARDWGRDMKLEMDCKRTKMK